LEEIFRCIGDNLGIYLDHDIFYIESGCLAITRILVHLDTREGLVESYQLQLGDINQWQILDYEGIPFRCRWCHEVGHLYKDCLLIIRTYIEPPKRFVTAGT